MNMMISHFQWLDRETGLIWSVVGLCVGGLFYAPGWSLVVWGGFGICYLARWLEPPILQE